MTFSWIDGLAEVDRFHAGFIFDKLLAGHFDQVPAKLGGHRVKFTLFGFVEANRVEFRHHHAIGKPAEVAAFGVVAAVAAISGRQRVEARLTAVEQGKQTVHGLLVGF